MSSLSTLGHFRIEARELLEQLGQGFVSLKEGADDARVMPQLFRWVHTLKGAAQVVRQVRLAEMAHAVEDALAPYREQGEPFPRESVGEFLQLVGQMREALAELESPAAPGAEEAPQEGPAAETVRVELAALDGLLTGLAEVVVQLGGLREAVEGVRQARHATEGLMEQLTSPAATSATPAERAQWLSRTLTVTEGVNTALTRAGRWLDGGLGRVEGQLTQLRDASHALGRWVREGEAVTSEVRATLRRRILVIDDSVTTRLLEQSILESAGYEVELAASGEEGMERALRGGHALIIVDVEMPGMSGLEFTRKLRATPSLAALPVIIVSSLSTEEDRRRGREAGASAYIVKGEFDQHGFVDTVARLCGGPAERGR